MSKFVGDKLPGDLYRRLAGTDLQSCAEKAILICTVDANGWPHPAILSYFEVVAKDEQNIRLAMYGNSSSVGNMRRNGKLTILVVDDRVAYYIKGAAEELKPVMDSAAYNSKLNLKVNQVLADEANEEYEAGAYISSGILYKRSGRPPAADEILRELLAA